MGLYSNELYKEDINNIVGLNLCWETIAGKTFLISGATGLVGSFLVDVLLSMDNGSVIYALSRNEQRAKARFSKWINDPRFVYISHDINKPLIVENVKTIDYVFHMASNTHPIQYSTDPIGTITTNVIGLQNMLEFALSHQSRRFVFASSNEIYGENRGDVEFFEEDYCGYINSNTMRAGYPESKRCGEALCQAYRAQRGLDVIVARLTRSYGPTMLTDDTKAISQFIRKAINREDIVLKSAGNQYYSYTYVADAVSGLLYCLLNGENGEAYNIADERSDITLKDLASIAARITGGQIVFEFPDSIEGAGYSKATKARLDGNKLKNLGWEAQYDIQSGMERTIRILSSDG